MNEKIKVPFWLYAVLGFLALAGSVIMVWGIVDNPVKGWASFLLNNYYFLSIALGASFFISLQYISQSGWSAAFKRVPEAMMAWIPVGGILFLLIGLGAHSLYHWTHAEAVAQDPVLAGKAGYLNLPFAFVRLLVFLALWVLMAWLIRRSSLLEDKVGGVEPFTRSEWYSKIYIFILAFSFSFFTTDWIMSVDAHWYSTLFALKNFIAAFYHGVAVMILIILILHSKGYFKFLNPFHLHDFTRYVFMLAIVYGYFWFAQFTLIWYGNIPEETVYYAIRWKPEWSYLFWADIIVNWAIPFVILLPPALSRNRYILGSVAVLLLFGFFIDLTVQIMPGTGNTSEIGFLQIGSWIGFAALFCLVFLYSINKASLIPINHPYLKESLDHQFV